MQEQLFTLVSIQLGIDEADIALESNFMNDLGADSLDTVELIMQFEEDFGLEIPDEDAEKILTVNEAFKYITKNS